MRVSEIDQDFSIELLGGRKFEVRASKGSGLDKFNVAFFTASCDKAETNKKYAEALKLDYPILSDPSKETANAYGAAFKRVTFYIDKDGKIAHIDKKVKASSHGKDVAKKLKELGL